MTFYYEMKREFLFTFFESLMNVTIIDKHCWSKIESVNIVPLLAINLIILVLGCM